MLNKNISVEVVTFYIIPSTIVSASVRSLLSGLSNDHRAIEF